MSFHYFPEVYPYLLPNAKTHINTQPRDNFPHQFGVLSLEVPFLYVYSTYGYIVVSRYMDCFVTSCLYSTLTQVSFYANMYLYAISTILIDRLYSILDFLTIFPSMDIQLLPLFCFSNFCNGHQNLSLCSSQMSCNVIILIL